MGFKLRPRDGGTRPGYTAKQQLVLSLNLVLGEVRWSELTATFPAHEQPLQIPDEVVRAREQCVL